MKTTTLETHVIPPRSGTSLKLARGQVLTVIDPEGEQVSDLIAYNAHDIEEYLTHPEVAHAIGAPLLPALAV